MRIRDFAGKRVHMIGIGGSSMSGLAMLLHDHGYSITGSDNYPSYLAEKVEKHGIPVHIGHRAEQVRGADLVIYSAAISTENPERQEAERLGIPQMERSTLLGQLMSGYKQAVGVSGTHGKTTATAMLTQALMQAGLNPSAHLGGSFEAIGGGTRVGDRGMFIAEACEFHSSFLEMRPTIAVVLNIQEDHLDYYRDIDHIAEAFETFVGLVPKDGLFIGNGDDARVRDIASRAACRCETFGLAETNDWHPINLHENEYGCFAFDVSYRGAIVAHIALQVGGIFNAMNALAALAAAHALGANTEQAAAGITAFTGVHRRLEYTGTVDGVRLYHDYGHNPVEMRGAVSVIAKHPHRRFFAVMQPHTYSRVKRLFDEYLRCCEAADETLVTA
ncbi:MAG: UDP-N-acetylmuramate--L-alanine ligase, partial [Oscillospiraceae bacterium]|nr:UDP-N-acetylmuramate--L-alanine ligase [Oscillospiraceae bacterium]